MPQRRAAPSGNSPVVPLQGWLSRDPLRDVATVTSRHGPDQPTVSECVGRRLGHSTGVRATVRGAWARAASRPAPPSAGAESRGPGHLPYWPSARERAGPRRAPLAAPARLTLTRPP